MWRLALGGVVAVCVGCTAKREPAPVERRTLEAREVRSWTASVWGPSAVAPATVHHEAGDPTTTPTTHPPAAHRTGDATPGAQAAMRRDRVIRVRPGDTLFALSETHQIALKALIQANALTAPYSLNVGQQLTLPAPNLHRVERGESLRDVAERFRVHYQSLALLNQMGRSRRVRAGQLVLLPALARDLRDTVEAPAEPRTRVASQPTIGAPRFAWPLEGTLLAGYSPNDLGARSTGLKIGADFGAPVRAARSGRVVYAGDGLRGYGNLLLIQHDTEWISAYAHADALFVDEGDQVGTGDIIARVGATGEAPTAQLHFEVRRSGRAVDPLSVLPQES